MDALSVETGIGPICRSKHGFNKPDSEPSWDEAMVALGKVVESVLDSDKGAAAWANRDARKVCNVLVYSIAADRNDALNENRIRAIFALGYRKLAAKLAMVLGGVSVTSDNGNADYLVLKAPYTDYWRPMAAIQGQYWDRKRKLRVVPAVHKAQLWAALVAMYPGKLCVGEKGIKVLK